MLNRTWHRWVGAVVLGMAVTPWALGVSTKFWTSATFEEFSRGNFSGVSLSREGTMSLAPQLGEVFSTDQAVIWAAVRDQRGNMFLGTGHSGKVFRLGPDLKGSTFYEAPEPDIFALAVDKNNQVYAGTSPDGKVYKIDSSGKGQEFFDPQAKYIWSMTFSSDGTLYVGTGDRGRIYRVRPDGKSDLFYDTQQSHVMSLAATPNNELIAGSEPNGLVYRFSSAGKAFVLYDSPLTEINRVTVARDGSVYAAALGSADDRRFRLNQPAGPGEQVPVQAVTTITVRAAQEPGLPPADGGEGSGLGGPGNNVVSQPQGGVGRVLSPGGLRAADGRTRSAVYRISPDGTAETLWNSPRENVFDLMPSETKLLFSTDDKGRIYELTPDRRVSLLTQTDQEETTRLIAYDNFFLATTANLGKVFRVGTQPAATGSYESEVRDTGAIAAWGGIRWTEELPSGTSIELYTRSGNSGRPDPTWSDWSAAYRKSAGEQISSPAARYVQWKAVFHSAESKSPSLQEVTLAYLPRNLAPTVTDMKVTPRGERNSAASAGQGAVSFAASASSRGGSGYAAAGRAAAQRGSDISWSANDPDQDELTHTLYFRGEGETEWKLLQADLKQNYFQLDNDILPDGKYRLKVVVSDSTVNPAGTAKTAEMISGPFVVDNAPPLVEVLEVKRTGNTATANFRAMDKTSVLTRAEYMLDAEAPVPVLAADGIIDSREETFAISINSLDAHEHLLTLRVYDASGNMSVGKALWPPAGPSRGR